VPELLRALSIEIPVKVTGFKPGSPWAHLNDKIHNYTFTPAEIVRAAIVAGYWDEVSIPSPEYRQWRAAAIRIAARIAHRTLVRPPEWGLLDSSEKAMITSLLGVVVTKLLAEKILGAPYLLFLDVHFHLIRQPGTPKVRPDFVALAPKGTEWVYFSLEAKGRARFSQASFEKGKKQAESLGYVDGKNVKAHVVCYTTLPRGEIMARFHDPKSDDEILHRAIAIQGEGLSRYYRSLQSILNIRDPVEESAKGLNMDGARLTRIPELDADVGIHPLVLGTLRNSPERLLSVLPEVAKLSRASGGEVGLDGIVVVPGPSWTKDNLHTHP